MGEADFREHEQMLKMPEKNRQWQRRLGVKGKAEGEKRISPLRHSQKRE